MVGWDPILFFFCAAEFLQTVRALERYEWVGKMTPFLQEIRLLVEGRSLLNWIVNLHPGKLTWQWKGKRLKVYLLSQRAIISLPCLFSVGFCHLLKVQGVINQIYHGFFEGRCLFNFWDVSSCLVCWIPWFKDHSNHPSFFVMPEQVVKKTFYEVLRCRFVRFQNIAQEFVQMWACDIFSFST